MHAPCCSLHRPAQHILRSLRPQHHSLAAKQLSSCSTNSRPCLHAESWALRATQRRDPIIAPFIQLGEDPQVWPSHLDHAHWHQAFASSFCSSHFWLPFQDGTDMFGYLLRNRIIFIGARIDDKVSNSCHTCPACHNLSDQVLFGSLGL